MKRADLETGTAQDASAKQIASDTLSFLAGLGIGVLLAFMVLFMKRSVVEKGAHVAAE